MAVPEGEEPRVRIRERDAASTRPRHRLDDTPALVPKAQERSWIPLEGPAVAVMAQAGPARRCTARFVVADRNAEARGGLRSPRSLVLPRVDNLGLTSSA